MNRRIVGIGIGLAWLMAACSVAPLPSPRPPLISPQATTASTPSIEPSLSRPTIAWEETGAATEVDTAVRQFGVETGGVRVSIEIDRNPVPASEFSWVTTTVENTGPDAIHWYTDGCAIHVGVWGELPLRWAWGAKEPSTGFAPEDWNGFTFKDWAINHDPGRGSEQPILLDFTPESFVGQGDFGCADVGIRQDLQPGKRVSQRERWDGQAAFGFGPAPSGPAELHASFRNWWRDSEVEGARGDIEIRLAIEIVGGRDPRFLSPGQAIDVALRVPAFRRLLDRYPTIQDWIMPVVVEVDDAGLWNVGLKGSDGSSVTVIVDPIQASVVDVLEVP
jgi:hypothetical protein